MEVDGSFDLKNKKKKKSIGKVKFETIKRKYILKKSFWLLIVVSKSCCDYFPSPPTVCISPLRPRRTSPTLFCTQHVATQLARRPHDASPPSTLSGPPPRKPPILTHFSTPTHLHPLAYTHSPTSIHPYSRSTRVTIHRTHRPPTPTSPQRRPQTEGECRTPEYIRSLKNKRNKKDTISQSP